MDPESMSSLDSCTYGFIHSGTLSENFVGFLGSGVGRETAACFTDIVTEE